MKLSKGLTMMCLGILCSCIGVVHAQEEELGEEERVVESSIAYQFDAKPARIEAVEVEKKKRASSKSNVSTTWIKVSTDIKVAPPKKSRSSRKSADAKIPAWIDDIDVVWYIGMRDKNAVKSNSKSEGIKVVCIERKISYMNLKVGDISKVAVYLSPKALERYGYKDGRGASEFLVYAEILYGGERVAEIQNEAGEKREDWWKGKNVEKAASNMLRKFSETPFWVTESWDILEEK